MNDASGNHAAVEDLLPLKPLDFSVLVVLSEEDSYGYGIVQRIADRDAGTVRLAPGNLYQVLDRMIDAGLIRPLDRREHPEGADGRRQYYGITSFGRRVAVAEARRLRAVLDTAESLLPVEGA